MPLGAIEGGIPSNHNAIKTHVHNEISCGFEALTSTLTCIRNNPELYTAEAKNLESVLENNNEYIKAILSNEIKNKSTLSLVNETIYAYAMIYSFNEYPNLYKKTEKVPMSQKLEHLLGKLHDKLAEHIRIKT